MDEQKAPDLERTDEQWACGSTVRRAVRGARVEVAVGRGPLIVGKVGILAAAEPAIGYAGKTRRARATRGGPTGRR